ncbi:unnamed protein product [Anisakis simplex]|uniref:peptidylamidoglycolate lyase n=1 Tax=Anisakis simplex TaxID=6269 RepID=A0A0M3J004_ANISI|nr:unnamed protein product [Anisakis simplex]
MEKDVVVRQNEERLHALHLLLCIQFVGTIWGNHVFDYGNLEDLYGDHDLFMGEDALGDVDQLLERNEKMSLETFHKFQAFILPVSKPLGQVTGIGIDSNNHLIAFHRADRTWDEESFDKENRFNRSLKAIKNFTIAVIDPESGKVLQESGDNMFFLPHGLTVDSDDNIWLTDVALHQVFKLDKNFKTQLILGEHLKPGNDNRHFCKPTDIAVAKNGHFFVADGYCNSRIMKFDKNGKFLTSFGSENSGILPEDGEFWIPHSLALIEDMNLICVADRENERIQCFSAGLVEDNRNIPTGIFITKAENIGRVFAIREKRIFFFFFYVEKIV